MVRCIAHTIIFNRAFGPLAPLEVPGVVHPALCANEHAKLWMDSRKCYCLYLFALTHVVQTESDLFDIVYPRCGIEEVQRKIDDQIPKLMASLVPVGPDLSRGQMSILFYEKRVSKAFFGMSTSTEKVNWEQWQIRLIVNTQPRDEVKTESAGTAGSLYSLRAMPIYAECALQMVHMEVCTCGIAVVQCSPLTAVWFAFVLVAARWYAAMFSHRSGAKTGATRSQSTGVHDANSPAGQLQNQPHPASKLQS